MSNVRVPLGIVLNSPINNANLKAVSLSVDIPVIITVISVDTDFEGRIKAGASIFNVAGGKDTSMIVERIRELYPDFPIIATGGKNEEDIHKTIIAVANAITITPPDTSELFSQMMNSYRENGIMNDYYIQDIFKTMISRKGT